MNNNLGNEEAAPADTNQQAIEENLAMQAHETKQN
jgi:hypothetical protein